jgi:16S rRNA (uracil1498-N3)-methyltransferase
MIPRIFVRPEQLAKDADQLALGEQDSHYLCQVLRLKPGATVQIFDGQGNRYDAQLAISDKRHSVVNALQPVKGLSASAIRITLVQGIARGDRMDWLIEKSCELGVHQIMPVNTANSTARVSKDRADKKQRHWHRVAVAACAQCGRDTVPAIAAVTSLTAAIAALGTDQCVICLTPGATQSLAQWCHTVSRSEQRELQAGAEITLVVGPESGFSETETKDLIERGAIALGIGPRILRTETAGITALTVLQTIAGDLQ